MTKRSDFAWQPKGRRTRLFPVLLFAGSILATVSGCHRAPSADVVATVNGKPIMRTEMDKQYQALIQQQQQQAPPSPEQADLAKLSVVSNLINEEIIEQRAAKMNLTATNEEVDAKLAGMKAPYTEVQFEEHLKAQNLTLDGLRQEIRHSLTINKLLNKEINS
ncbi:MAG TPA: SurA N-terminal domain-containing protein, partial [Granulicella sp.]|nr:SurA N-terminal domain-containing protein [Granulicella sp.]